MAMEITVQLFPAPGGGVQVINTPQGQLPVPIPFISYERVRECEIQTTGTLMFVTRAGDKIETNIPYLVKRTMLPDGDA